MATQATSASQRSLSDTTTPHGYATSRALDRVLSSCGLLNGVPLRFERADDVAKGGVLFALPALLNEGLLCHTREHYALPPGYYPLETIFSVGIAGAGAMSVAGAHPLRSAGGMGSVAGGGQGTGHPFTGPRRCRGSKSGESSIRFNPDIVTPGPF